MKILGLKTVRAEVPLDKPLRTAIHDFRSVGALLVSLDAGDGLVGEGYLFVPGTRQLGVFDEMVRSFAPVLVGADPEMSEALWRQLWSGINFYGHKGVSVFALSVVDMALWDLRGKALGRPIHRLLGGCRSLVPTYASGGLWLGASLDELVAEAKSFVKAGFRAMKMRLGKPRLEEDVARATAVREAIGPDIALMADANQGFTVDHAIRLGRRLEGLGLAWFEEPVPAWDLDGSARVAAALDTPIASGETEYARYGFRDMLKAGAADVLMPDLGRVGGVSEFVKVAHMADALDIPVSSHIYTEQSIGLVAALGNATYLEHMPWFGRLFRETLEMQDGMVVVPERPGFGFTFDPDAVERYRI
ncbi:MAG TPA: mandelate racemase/muconate lactonizing enzyme family protein [Stellaceae bacterium]|nr:mandelate racemase/muconate lactonizing enzyme family protein [Stellaceae bacterium]